MPSYFVTQPNGEYALFSTIVDMFTAVGFTEADCMDWYREHGCNSQESEHNWGRVIADVVPLEEDKHDPNVHPLNRWHDCLNTILWRHGTAALAQFLAENRETYDELPVAVEIDGTHC